ncbi:hypothetical protein BM86_34670 [Bacillus thuringiensis]|uniref:Hemolysin BL lytic component L1 n=1 Tax=Bacillus thuringiensis TaxID=1428 RepID=A0A9W3SI98_BACTU|nr:HBL/NHE enterotoxin family protein [Bacillus thuringiensis]ANS51829.1 hemolysin BL lytic component L1 [Bacillus thuringiensis]MBH0340438.1 hypothetical protein [Bacillus thuringiensis]
MKKIPYKVLTVATLLTIATASNAQILHTFAQEQVVQEQAYKESNSELGPGKISETLEQTQLNMTAMDIYAATVSKQPDIDLSNVPLEAKELKLVDKIHTDQKSARDHATYWDRTAKPELQGTAQMIVNFDTEFNNYYQSLVDAVEKKDVPKIRKDLNDLRETLTDNSNDVDRIIKMLKDFRENLYQDTTAFKNDVYGVDGNEGLHAILAGKNALIPQLKEQINQLHTTQQKHFHNMLAWGISGGVGTVLLIGGTVAIVVTGGMAMPYVLGTAIALEAGLGAAATIEVTKNLNAYNSISTKIKELNAQADSTTSAAIALENGVMTLNDLCEKIDQAIIALTKMKEHWDMMGSDYKVLIEQLDFIQPSKLSMLLENLETAKDEWNDISKKAELVANGLSTKN